MLRSVLYKVLTVRYVMQNRGIPGEYKISLVVKHNEMPDREDLKAYVLWARETVLGADVSDEERNTLMILHIKVKSPVISIAEYNPYLADFEEKGVSDEEKSDDVGRDGRD